MQAALGISQLKRIETFKDKRREIFKAYQDAFADDERFSTLVRNNFVQHTLYEVIRPIEGITFFNATYSTEVWQELDSIANKEKTLVHNFPELDQKDDLVATAAYLSNMDLVITIGTAVGELAAALGTNVIRTTNLAQSSKCELKKHGYDLPNTYRLEKKYNKDWTVIFNKLKLILEEYKDTGKIPYPKDQT